MKDSCVFVYICLKVCAYLSAFVVCIATILSAFYECASEKCNLQHTIKSRCFPVRLHLPIFPRHQKKRQGGLQSGKGKGRKEEGAEGGEGPVSFISSATVHEPCWLRYYFNSPSHLPYYLLIYAHHYGGCSRSVINSFFDKGCMLSFV